MDFAPLCSNCGEQMFTVYFGNEVEMWRCLCGMAKIIEECDNGSNM